MLNNLQRDNLKYFGGYIKVTAPEVKQGDIKALISVLHNSQGNFNCFTGRGEKQNIDGAYLFRVDGEMHCFNNVDSVLNDTIDFMKGDIFKNECEKFAIEPATYYVEFFFKEDYVEEDELYTKARKVFVFKFNYNF